MVRCNWWHGLVYCAWSLCRLGNSNFYPDICFSARGQKQFAQGLFLVVDRCGSIRGCCFSLRHENAVSPVCFLIRKETVICLTTSCLAQQLLFPCIICYTHL